MTERVVWVKGTLVHDDGGDWLQVVFDTNCGKAALWVQTKDIRADGAEPTLRAAAERMVKWYDAPADYGFFPEQLAALRVKLAEAPIEGPVREGDTVRFEGTAIGLTPSGSAVGVNESNGAYTHWISLDSLTIIARAKPAETCGHCRWYSPDCAKTCRLGRYPDGPFYVDESNPVCHHFQPYQVQGNN